MCMVEFEELENCHNNGNGKKKHPLCAQIVYRLKIPCIFPLDSFAAFDYRVL